MNELDMVLADKEYNTAQEVLRRETEKIQIEFELAIQYLRSQISGVEEGGAQAFDGKAAQNILDYAEQVRNLIAGRLRSFGVGLGKEFGEYVENIDRADKSLF